MMMSISPLILAASGRLGVREAVALAARPWRLTVSAHAARRLEERGLGLEAALEAITAGRIAGSDGLRLVLAGRAATVVLAIRPEYRQAVVVTAWQPLRPGASSAGAARAWSGRWSSTAKGGAS